MPAGLAAHERHGLGQEEAGDSGCADQAPGEPGDVPEVRTEKDHAYQSNNLHGCHGGNCFTEKCFTQEKPIRWC